MVELTSSMSLIAINEYMAFLEPPLGYVDDSSDGDISMRDISKS